MNVQRILYNLFPHHTTNEFKNDATSCEIVLGLLAVQQGINHLPQNNVEKIKEIQEQILSISPKVEKKYVDTGHSADMYHARVILKECYDMLAEKLKGIHPSKFNKKNNC